MENKKFYDAVDVVCLECAFKEDDCNTCPVRMTADKRRQSEVNNEKDRQIKRAILERMFK